MVNFLVFILGLCVGSFLNVVICRLETKEPIIKGRSHCPDCGRVLKWFDLIPLLSFLIQRGECRYCGKRISWQYPIVETATALLFLLIFNQFSIFQFLNLIYYCLIVSALIVVFVYDLKHYLIPDKIIYPAIGLALGWQIGLNLEIFNPILSAFGSALFFLSLVLITKGKGMGMGDVKLVFLMGLVLGWPGIIFALMLAFFSGALVGLSLIALGKKKMGSEIPFGPFLAGATLVVILGSGWLNFWLNKILL